MRQRGFTLIELLIVVAIIGIIASIAIPSLVRARVSANEASVLADTRTVISSEATYHAANNGHYGVLTCLATPSNAACIPGYASTAPTFIDPVIATLANKNGYLRAAQYAPGAGPNPGDREAYCYQGRPLSVNRTGVRSLGGDSSGALAGTLADVDCCLGTGFLDTGACPLSR